MSRYFVPLDTADAYDDGLRYWEYMGKAYKGCFAYTHKGMCTYVSAVPVTELVQSAAAGLYIETTQPPEGEPLQ